MKLRLGERLARIRQQRGLSLGEVERAIRSAKLKDENGEQIILGRPGLSRVEDGEHLPTVRSMQALALVYGVTFEIGPKGVTISKQQKAEKGVKA